MNLQHVNKKKKRDVQEDEQFDDVRKDEYNYEDNFTPQVDEETGEIKEEDIDFESSVSLGKQYLAKEYRKYQKKYKRDSNVI